MRTSATLFTLLLALGQARSVSGTSSCRKSLVRKEWRTLSDTDKVEYTNAVQCLMNLPAQTQNLYTGVQNRFDDFQGLHIDQTDFIHFVGHFQPWRRMLVAKYEADLRELCGYSGAQPFWDWTLDSWSTDDFPNSPVFDPDTGFGGNGPYIDSSEDNSVSTHIPGKTGGGCITDGPFANMSVNLGPGYTTAYNPRCLRRDFAPEFAVSNLNISMVAWTLSADSFAEFDIRVQGGTTVPEMTYHGGGHLGVGGDLGEIGNVYSSPGDPLFYMHHANIDRLWWLWQKMDWRNRKNDIAGPDTMFAYPFNFFGDVEYANVTLDYEMDFGELFGAGSDDNIVKVGDVMDTKGGKLCYTYYRN
ncbi:hypothetical protein MKZ38_003846 [Zalerion maritima]|uniref:Tyrosinase copper-binding domain-containing protein n=1 Tax=Zalerion maritima TaxID=339359 RepID=A0AAD5WPZ9_9PEZI|nr:hypothetical protein MKZ38_003846 [Zalerion maritima]